MSSPEPVLLTHQRSPGDIVCMTGAVRDLAVSHPGRFAIHIQSECPELWEHNPHIAGNWHTQWPRDMKTIRVCCRPQLNAANSIRLHYVTAFHRAISTALDLAIPVLQPHGDLHLTDEERETPLIRGRYWYFVAGGKSDMVTKIWPEQFSHRLVPLLTDLGINLVQDGAAYPGHIHPVLAGVRRMVGQTSLRDVLRLIYHADGVICPVTFAMHVAGAFSKPCVVIAGGREPWWWEGYSNSADRHFGAQCSSVRVPHRFLHTQGMFDCCRDGGCWKTKLTASLPGGQHDCLKPEADSTGVLSPACLRAITPEMVVEAVRSYYRDGTLEPLRNAVNS